jgi:hypothetical protein
MDCSNEKELSRRKGYPAGDSGNCGPEDPHSHDLGKAPLMHGLPQKIENYITVRRVREILASGKRI